MTDSRVPIGLSNPKSLALIQEGFEAFETGHHESPYIPSYENYWWHQGWDAAAIARYMRVHGESASKEDAK